MSPPDRAEAARRWLRWADEDLEIARHTAAVPDLVARGACVWVEDKDTPVELPDEVALRPDARGCGTDFLSEDSDVEGRARRCLLDAHQRGDTAEAWSYEEGSDPERPDFSIHVTSPFGVVVFKHARDEPWTSTRCTGLERTGEPGVFRVTGCGNPRVLP